MFGFNFPGARPRLQIRCAFTLVEVLVVLFILLLLSSIALPLTKKLLNDQKTTKAAQSIEAFMDLSRSRAVAEGRIVGVRLERLSNNASAGSARSASVIVRQLVGVPPYSGDASNAVARLDTTGTNINFAEFDNADSPLLFLSSTILNNEISPGVPDLTDDNQSPIRIGDLIELPGGRLVPILGLSNSGSNTTATFNFLEPVDPLATPVIPTFPGGGRPPVNSVDGDLVKFRIHRSPTPSRSNLLSLNRGLAIDLNYSGVGLDGVNFAPSTTASLVQGPVDILFSPDGTISNVINNGVRLFPQSLIFLCVGSLDGVANIESTTTDDAFSIGKRFTANIMNQNSIWIVINPSNGRVSSVPFASIESEVTALRALSTPPNFKDPTDSAFANVIQESREFATFSDTVAQ